MRLATIANQQWNDWYEIVKNERVKQNPLGFTREFQYLIYLKIQKGLNQDVYNENIEEALEISKKQAYLYGVDLENKELITRERQKDRRKKIEITKKGEDLLYQRVLVIFSEPEQRLVLRIIQNENPQIEEIAIEVLLNNFIEYIIPKIKLTIESFIQKKPSQEKYDQKMCVEIHKSICKLLYKFSENFTQKLNGE